MSPLKFSLKVTKSKSKTDHANLVDSKTIKLMLWWIKDTYVPVINSRSVGVRLVKHLRSHAPVSKVTPRVKNTPPHVVLARCRRRRSCWCSWCCWSLCCRRHRQRPHIFATILPTPRRIYQARSPNHVQYMLVQNIWKSHKLEVEKIYWRVLQHTYLK